jgi:hypothetical protein
MGIFNRNLDYIHDKSGKLYIVLFFDVIWCKIRYGITNNEYRIFEFYKINSDKRKTYLSKRYYRRVNKRLVPIEISNVLTDKELFNNRFKKYLNRDVNNINDLSFKQVEDFILSNNTVLVRSTSSSYLNSYEELNLKNFRSPAFLAEDAKEKNKCIMEKKITQAKDMNSINNVVLLNVVSVYDKKPEIVSSSIKFKSGSNTISGYVDIKKKCIKGWLKDQEGNDFSKDYDGLEIPKFEEVLEIVKELSKELEEIKQVEWSFIIGSKSIYLVDGNIWDDYVFIQTPEFLNNRVGLMSYYKKFTRFFL